MPPLVNGRDIPPQTQEKGEVSIICRLILKAIRHKWEFQAYSERLLLKSLERDKILGDLVYAKTNAAPIK